MIPRLDGKVAVITGAASGIGLATVGRFVEEGARVVAADVREDEGRALEARFPGAVRFARCDVTRLDELKAAVDLAPAAFGGLDVMFSNAGAGGLPGGVDAFDQTAWDATYALLVRSVAAGAAYALPHLKARGGGAILNTASIAAMQAGWGPLAYSSAKAAVLHWTRVAAAELAPLRIRVNAICPGFIATNIFGHSLGLSGEDARRIAETVAQRSHVSNPIGRAGQATDIAEAAVYLASDAAGFVTGTQLVVDGGITTGPRHAWDRETNGPIGEAIGMTRAQIEAMREAAKRGDAG
jgi:NAD(P)-dependent dehydrogenase (short-subunit alcohol dehydrogenase family)